jgi:hypothetical protein
MRINFQFEKNDDIISLKSFMKEDISFTNI